MAAGDLVSPVVLPEGFILRVPTMDDALQVTDLMNAHDILMGGEPGMELSEVVEEWQSSRFDLSQDAWLIEAPAGQIVGFESCADFRHDGQISIDGYVHPDHMGRRIGTYLLRMAEKRAREHLQKYPPEVRITANAGCYANDKAAHAMFGAEGYEVIRYFWRMNITMETAPPEPVFPEGITVRAFVLNQDEQATYAATTESFGDHWNFTPRPFEIWAEDTYQSEGFDPTLYFLAIDNSTGEIAGVSLCRVSLGDGWLSTLGVRRPWRKKGLGMALLQHTFAEFYRRGYRRVGLGVDASNPTGATRLYERAGMKVAQQFAFYEKEIRPVKAD